MTRLSVNVNKVALLRNSRPLDIPNVLHLSRLAIEAGAQGITVHPRPDGRHILPNDVYELRALTKAHGVELNVEGNPFHGLLELVRSIRPQQCTLVPDDAGALTSDHGWDLRLDAVRLAPVVTELKALGVRVSLFIDPVASAMPAARALGADRVELYTEPYARAFGKTDESAVLDGYRAAAASAQKSGLGVNAGHDLNRANLSRFLHGVPHVLEVSIGHALVADALEFGMTQTVKLYLDVIRQDGGA